MADVARLRRAVVPVIALIVLAVALGARAWSGGGGSSDTQPHVAADVAFATGMVRHHEATQQMAATAGEHRLSAAVGRLADRLRADQQAQVDQLRGWLAGWGEPMPLLLTGEVAAGLPARDGPGFERAWLRAMIAHDERAVEMARTELDHGRYPPTLELAGSVVDSESAEIDRLQRLLER